MESSNRPNRLPGMFIGCAVWILVLSALLNCIPRLRFLGGYDFLRPYFSDDFARREWI
jgi:hypothetical protein